MQDPLVAIPLTLVALALAVAQSRSNDLCSAALFGGAITAISSRVGYIACTETGETVSKKGVPVGNGDDFPPVVPGLIHGRHCPRGAGVPEKERHECREILGEDGATTHRQGAFVGVRAPLVIKEDGLNCGGFCARLPGNRAALVIQRPA